MLDLGIGSIPTMFQDIPVNLANSTLRGLQNDTAVRDLRYFNKPGLLEKKLGPEMVSLFTEAQFKAWLHRKSTNNEEHIDAQSRYQELPQGVKEFTKGLNLGKLAATLAYVSREGIELMAQLGKNGGSLSDTLALNSPIDREELVVLRANGSEVTLAPIHLTMLELHHDNWLNLLGGKTHEFGLENHTLLTSFWEKSVKDPVSEEPKYLVGMGRHAYNADAIQVDNDLEVWANMPENFMRTILELAQEGRGNFFRPGASFSVRDTSIPAVSTYHGDQFAVRSNLNGLESVMRMIALGQMASEFNTLIEALDNLRIPTEERELFRGLFYDDDGKMKPRAETQDNLFNLKLVLEQLQSDNRKVEHVKTAEILTLVKERMEA